MVSLASRLECSALDLVALFLRHREEALALASVLALAIVARRLASAFALAGIGADTMALAWLGGGCWRRDGTGENECGYGGGN